jgi:hypothetical protein
MGEGCCPNPQVRKLKVKNAYVGIVAMEPAFNKVKEMNLHDMEEIKGELLKEIKIYNFVPDSVDREYAEALYIEYMYYLRGK